MNRTDSELARVFAEVKQSTNPKLDDRARISERLRNELGADVVDGATPPEPSAAPPRLEATPSRELSSPAPVVPALRGASGRAGWISAVIGAGIVMGALGFVLGYGTGQRDRAVGVAATATAATATTATATTATVGGTAPVTPTDRLDSERGTPLPSPGAAPAASAPSSARRVELSAPARRRDDADPHKRPPTRSHLDPSTENAERSKAPARSGSAESASSLRPPDFSMRWGFAEVLEKLRRANRALTDDRPSLALIELDQLERRAGETLREEREVTRILAECALGHVGAATRRAERLLRSSASSIYAPRLEHSCARQPDGSPAPRP